MGRWTKEEAELAEEAAQATIELMNDGAKNVSGLDIAARIYEGKRVYSYMEFQYVKLMPWIKSRVKQARPTWHLYGVNRHFYEQGFNLTPPETLADARKCLPGGNGLDTRGISICRNGESDLVWQAHTERTLGIGTGILGTTVEALLNQVQSERLTAATAMEMLGRQSIELDANQIEAVRLLFQQAEQQSLLNPPSTLPEGGSHGGHNEGP